MEHPRRCRLLALGLRRWRRVGGAGGIGPFPPTLVPGPCSLQDGRACSPRGAGGALLESSCGGASETAFDVKSATKGS